MSLEEFIHAAEWNAVSEVDGLQTPCWKDMEGSAGALFTGLDDDDEFSAEYLSIVNDVDAGYLTSPLSADECDVSVYQNSLSQGGKALTESWLDSSDFLSEDNRLYEDVFASPIENATTTSRPEVDETCGDTQPKDNSSLPEVTISELEALLMFDNDNNQLRTTPQLSGYVTVCTDQLQSFLDADEVVVDVMDVCVNSDTDSSHNDDDYGRGTSSLDEADLDDYSDTTWNYRANKKRRPYVHHRSRSYKRRQLRASTAKLEKRKNLQNKTAATRYREKKRSEELENEMICAELETTNKELRSRVEDMTQEVAVLRRLVIDIFRNPIVHKDLDINVLNVQCV